VAEKEEIKDKWIIKNAKTDTSHHYRTPLIRQRKPNVTYDTHAARSIAPTSFDKPSP